MTKNILVIPDTHFPLVDKRLWKSIIEIVQLHRPDEIIHIGDLMDYPQPSRWTKGTRHEFEGSVFEDSEKAIRQLLEPLREAYDGPIGVIEGNHDARTRLYLEKYAPALAETGAFDFDKLLRFDELEITKLPDFYKFAPGWVATHGHLANIRLSQNAGNTALNAAKKLGTSLVMGHTHRAGISSYTTGYQGNTNTVTGVEVGHIMDPKKVTYLKGGTGNWQTSLAWLTVEKKHVTPNLLQVSDSRISIGTEVLKV